MGTHPIFESDFDCLTEMDRFDAGSAQHIILTGPSGTRNHRVKIEDEHRKIGIGDRSELESSELKYLDRKSKVEYSLYSKNQLAGGIGWRHEKSVPTVALDGEYYGIKKGEFRQAAEFLTTIA